MLPLGERANSKNRKETSRARYGFPGFLIIATEERQTKDSLSFKERARVRMGFICVTGDA
jgi:hypothetical protein